MSFATERDKLVNALQQAGLADIRFNRDDLPKTLPAALVTLESEDSRLATGKRYLETTPVWAIHLIVNAHQAVDPDADLHALKEAFRAAYIALNGKDFAHIDYYSARLDGARSVRVARLSTGKGGSS